MNLVKHFTNEEAKQSHLKALGNAVYTGRWMAMVWCIDDNRNIVANNTTYNFPIESFDAAIRDLMNSCETKRKEVAESIMPPLPLAPHLMAQEVPVETGGNGEEFSVDTLADKLEDFNFTDEEKNI